MDTTLLVAIVGGVAALYLLFGFYTLKPNMAGIISFAGNPIRVKRTPGLGWRWLMVQSVTKVSLKTRQLPVKEVAYTTNDLTQSQRPVDAAQAEGTAANTGTETPVTTNATPGAGQPSMKALASVTIEGVVQFFVKADPQSIINSQFTLENPEQQIDQHFKSTIRAVLPRMSLWSALSDKQHLETAVKDDLEHTMAQYGFGIANVNLTTVTPDAAIVEANDALMASEAQMRTQWNLGEGERSRKVLAAKGDADAAIERGRGIAGERRNVVEGLKELVKEYCSDVEGTTAHEAMAMIMFHNYLDAMVNMAKSGQTKVMFMPGNPGAATDTVNALTQTLVAASEAAAAKPGANATKGGEDTAPQS